MIKFKWSGKKKQVCRVNGAIIGFFVVFHQRGEDWISWDTRFHTNFRDTHSYPKNADSARTTIEENFKTWLAGVYE